MFAGGGGNSPPTHRISCSVLHKPTKDARLGLGVAEEGLVLLRLSSVVSKLLDSR